MSSCNEVSDSPVSSGPVTSSVDDLILDAARTCILDFGLRRTTLAEIARRAGVSRPTVYRRWPDTRAVVADLLTREIATVVPQMGGDDPVRTRLVRGVVEVAAGVREHPLFAKILRSDPDLLMTYIVERIGTSQRAIVALLSQTVAAGQQDGSIRAGEPAHLAAMVLLIAQSAVQSAGMIADVLPADPLTTELALAVDAYLAPR
ncbi:TetR/AcrR family transcriptional regulator [Prescottella sp. R16]|uniref:TetR/AcrR family transcriptional regulator n=1 Tax=Prescottella sp. R16 TaxID=3064529 RepID=UPI00272DF762|nr:TetR/AcrR family transcriptional regulator [Prescottella sp. R16]